MPGAGHGQDGVLHLLVGISEGTVQPVPGLLGMRGDLRIWDGQIVQLHQILVQPLAVGLAGGVVFLDLVIVQHLPLLRIDQEHPAGTQTVLLHDMGLVQIQHAHFGSQDQPVVVHEIVPGGPQTVAVQHGSHQFASEKRLAGGPSQGSIMVA